LSQFQTYFHFYYKHLIKILYQLSEKKNILTLQHGFNIWTSCFSVLWWKIYDKQFYFYFMFFLGITLHLLFYVLIVKKFENIAAKWKNHVISKRNDYKSMQNVIWFITVMHLFCFKFYEQSAVKPTCVWICLYSHFVTWEFS